MGPKIHDLIVVLPNLPKKEQALKDVMGVIRRQSLVCGKWATEVSPSDNVLFWIRADTEEIAHALTSLCLPFYGLRPYEFTLNDHGKHLKALNNQYAMITKFICTSVLVGFNLSVKEGVEVLQKWLDVGQVLREMRNYHMLFALQNALMKHQLDRLGKLKSKMDSKHKKMKKELDALFDPNNRMSSYIEEQKKYIGKRPVIPCIYWLLHQAYLLDEVPKKEKDGSLNTKLFVAAANIFKDLTAMQEHKYEKLKEGEVLWYFQALESEAQEIEQDEESLYQLSDGARLRSGSVKGRRDSTNTLKRIKSKKKWISEDSDESTKDLLSLRAKRTSSDGEISRDMLVANLRRQSSSTSAEDLVANSRRQSSSTSAEDLSK